MAKPIEIYLHDHFAGAESAVSLLNSLRHERTDVELSRFADALLPEIERDKETLAQIIDRLDAGVSAVKKGGARLSGRIFQLNLKLNRRHGNAFAAFEALEAIALGIRGKQALWHALGEWSAEEPRLQDFDLAELHERAKAQFETVEERRLAAAKPALASG